VTEQPQGACSGPPEPGSQTYADGPENDVREIPSRSVQIDLSNEPSDLSPEDGCMRSGAGAA
jgi:hypothetical protein